MNAAAREIARWGLALPVVIASAVYVALNAANQWDFRTYYFAGAAVRTGLNPYDPEVLSSVSGMAIELPFLYPPAALVIFSLMSLMPLAVASWIWLGLKVLLAGTLMAVWRRDFLPAVRVQTLVVVSLVGYDVAMLWDLRTGNVALIEAALLWLAFSSYVRGKWIAFSVLIAAASAFKLFPLVFLLLLLLPGARDRGGVALLCATAGVATALVWMPGALSGEWVRAVLRSIGAEQPGVDVNPSALGILDEVVRAWNGGIAEASVVAVVLFLAYAGVVLATSWSTLRRIGRTPDARDSIVTLVLLWLLLSPRVMVYSYVSAVVPTLAVIDRTIDRPHLRTAATLLVLTGCLVRFLPGPAPDGLGYLSFAMLLGTWLLWIRRTSSSRGRGRREGAGAS